MTRFLMCLVLAASAHGAPVPFLKGRAGGLVGEWRQVAVEFEGADQWPGEGPTLNRWIITEERITIITRGKQDRGSWSYRVRADGIDLTTGRTTYPCLFKLEGDRLTLCLQNHPERGRPADLVSRKGSGVGRFVYVRMKPGEFARQRE
ncbi:MAG: hypothetical protein K2W96_05115 [Gemmataceae bacterium]|nr:hypothetical protein [Gemmataceae bacterium]